MCHVHGLARFVLTAIQATPVVIRRCMFFSSMFKLELSLARLTHYPRAARGSLRKVHLMQISLSVLEISPRSFEGSHQKFIVNERSEMWWSRILFSSSDHGPLCYGRLLNWACPSFGSTRLNCFENDGSSCHTRMFLRSCRIRCALQHHSKRLVVNQNRFCICNYCWNVLCFSVKKNHSKY